MMLTSQTVAKTCLTFNIHSEYTWSHRRKRKEYKVLLLCETEQRKWFRHVMLVGGSGWMRGLCRQNLREMKGSKRKLERKNKQDFWLAAVMSQTRCSLKGIIGSLTTKCALRPECRKKHRSLIGKTDSKSCRENSHSFNTRICTWHLKTRQ